MIERLRNYLREVKLEWSKVSKPSYKEVWGSTVVVIVAVAIVAVFLFFVDLIFSRVLRLFFMGLSLIHI